MGYFDGLTSSSFKIGQDGRKLFFPWGVRGRGYAIDSEQDYGRLRQQVKAYMVATLVLIIVSGWYDRYLGPLAAAVLLIGFYRIWMWRVLPRLERSYERMSLQESVNSQARAHGTVVLWLLEIIAIIFVGTGILIFILDPASRLSALASTVFFGLCLAKITLLLVVRHSATVTRA